MEDIEKVIDGLEQPYILQDITFKASEQKFIAINYDKNSKKLDIIIYF